MAAFGKQKRHLLLDKVEELNKNSDLNIVTVSRQANIEAAQRELEILTEQAAHLREQIEQASKTPIVNPLLPGSMS